MDSPDAVGEANRNGRSPQVTIYLRIRDGAILRAMFTVFGCGCTIAACSVLSEMAEGLLLDDHERIRTEAVAKSLGGIPSDKRFCVDIAVQAFHMAVANAVRS